MEALLQNMRADQNQALAAERWQEASMIQQAICLVLDSSLTEGFRIANEIRNIFQRLYRVHRNRGDDERRDRFMSGLPRSLSRILDDTTIFKLNYESGLIAAAVTVMLKATAPEEFGIPECSTTLDAAGLEGPHRWGIILPNSSRVSMLTYKAVVAVRYPELVVQAAGPIQIGHFVPHDLTVEYSMVAFELSCGTLQKTFEQLLKI